MKTPFSKSTVIFASYPTFGGYKGIFFPSTILAGVSLFKSFISQIKLSLPLSRIIFKFPKL
ncbi:MAG: hypothetical protein LBT07_00225 [Endomicrobium sp.]|nr:hypothetical protein [Endomicrobium sp.]